MLAVRVASRYDCCLRGREAVTRLAHTQEIAGSNPAPATNTMSAITWADVIAIASELSVIDVTAQDIILDFVNGHLNPRMMPEAHLKLARINLAAHIGTQSLPDDLNATGSITSKEVGGIKITYAAIATGLIDGSIEGSVYGQMYRFLQRNSYARLPRVLNGRGLRVCR